MMIAVLFDTGTAGIEDVDALLGHSLRLEAGV